MTDADHFRALAQRYREQAAGDASPIVRGALLVKALAAQAKAREIEARDNHPT